MEDPEEEECGDYLQKLYARFLGVDARRAG